MTNFRFVYMYRDASNYKQHGEVILPNETQRSVEEVDTQIRSVLSDGLFFIAQQVQVELREESRLHGQSPLRDNVSARLSLFSAGLT